jgi:dienelactone hydrolase
MFEGMARAASDQLLATVARARQLPWVDASRWVAIGQSVGGMATVALAWRRPPGLVAAVNFAGGAGGNPQGRPGEPCSPDLLETLWRSRAREAVGGPPMLWLYWRNDLSWGEQWPQRWAQAWREGGAPMTFHLLDAVGLDGHSGISIDMDRWVPLVETFLAQYGFTRPGTIERPRASGFAALNEVNRLPGGPVARELYERRFLAAKPPRAFAIGPQGASGWAAGDWAMGRALGLCQGRSGLACKLYAVDDDVVWAP